MNAPDTVAAVKNLLAQGIRNVKLKIGLAALEDAERVRRVRSELGRDFRVSLDANGGYETTEAITLLTGLAGQDIEFVEQPVPASDLDGLALVNRESPIPVCADEAVHGMKSLLPILSRKAARLVNVKLEKCGGITEAETMVRTAESAGIGVLLGCMIETRVGISAALAVALGMANVVHTDLDGAHDLAADPVASGGARMAGGRQFMDDRDGLGLSLDPTVLRQFRDEDPNEP
jgi:L-alanine-DL-glutamate epimerase-like enolase superfamily enzyme